MRNTSRCVLCLVGAIAAVALTAIDSKGLIIDTFATPQTVIAAGVDGSTANGAVSSGGADILGGVRDVRLVNGVGTGGGNFRLDAYAGAPYNVLQVQQNALNRSGTAYTTWDGIGNDSLDPTGLGGVDFTPNGIEDRFAILADEGSSLDVPVTITVYSDATHYSSLTEQLPAGATSYYMYFYYGDFVAGGGDGGVDWNSVGAVQMAVTQNKGSSSYFSFFESNSSIPEPGTFVLMGAVALAGAAARRRKAKAALAVAQKA